tara:strand:- start:527 stop:664 length:138 start_codon:yes stop_codon:yes gene_type:complete
MPAAADLLSSGVMPKGKRDEIAAHPATLARQKLPIYVLGTLRRQR